MCKVRLRLTSIPSQTQAAKTQVDKQVMNKIKYNKKIETWRKRKKFVRLAYNTYCTYKRLTDSMNLLRTFKSIKKRLNFKQSDKKGKGKPTRRIWRWNKECCLLYIYLLKRFINATAKIINAINEHFFYYENIIFVMFISYKQLVWNRDMFKALN